MKQKIRKATIIGDITVNKAHTKHYTQPHINVLQVVDVETDLLPYPSIVVVVISY